jgi:hypothetical protein
MYEKSYPNVNICTICTISVETRGLNSKRGPSAFLSLFSSASREKVNGIQVAVINIEL